MEDVRFASPPQPRSPVFGRDREIAAVRDLLEGGARLVTVTGAGGIGKTRLAIEVALRAEWAVRFVPLADVQAQDLLATLARRLAPAAAPDRSSLPSLVDVLSDGRTLLVLDTFEHLMPAAGVVGQLVDACPHLHVLVTSRSRLRLDGEQVYELPPLDVGGDGAAVAMLRARVDAVGGQLGAEDAVAADICRQLDGLPLAIELAAARTTVLPGPALLAQLTAHLPSRVLDVLARGATDVEVRHRSMRGTIAWSYALLDADAQSVLRRCGVFTGSFALDAAARVSGSEHVLDALATLVDLHLVEPVEPVAGAARFRLLDTIRGFAQDVLDDAERADVEDRLLAWAAAFGADAGTGLLSVAEREWLERVDAELPTLRTVLSRQIERGDVVGGLRLATRLAPFWLHRGPMWEGRGWLAALLQADTEGSLPDRERAVAVGWAGRLSLDEGDLSVLQDISTARSRLGNGPDERCDWLQATEHLAYALTLCGDLDEADRLTAEAVDVSEKYGEDYWHATFLQRRALSAERRGDLSAAGEHATQTVAVARAIGYARVVARAEQILARIQAVTAGPVQGARLLRENLTAHRDCGDLRGVVSAQASLGAVTTDPAVSAHWYLAGIDEARRIGYWQGEAMCVFGLAATAALSGEPAEAVRLDAMLAQHLPVLRAGVPAHAATGYARAIAAARAAAGDVTDGASGSVPWCTVRQHAREVAARLGASHARPEPAVERPDKRRRGPRSNPDLTEREREILELLCSGRTNRQIAAGLALSPKTVMHHTSSVYRKLGVRGRAEAIAHAYRHGVGVTRTAP